MNFLILSCIFLSAFSSAQDLVQIQVLREQGKINQALSQIQNIKEPNEEVRLEEAHLLLLSALYDQAKQKAHPLLSSELASIRFQALHTSLEADLALAKLKSIDESRLENSSGLTPHQELQNLLLKTRLKRLQGQYRASLLLAKQALKFCKNKLSHDTKSINLALNNLATEYKIHADFSEAKTLAELSLANTKKSRGEKHLDSAIPMTILANIHKEMGHYPQAEKLYQTVLSIYENQLSKSHPLLAKSLNNLAVLYRLTGRQKDALPLFKRARSICLNAFGELHPDSAICLNNLAENAVYLGEYEKAADMYKTSLVYLKKTLGRDHPLLAITLSNYADLLRIQGDIRMADYTI